MLHDLLFGLCGKSGCFVRQTSPDAPFLIDDSISFFSKPEINILNQIVELGYHYQQIENFLNEEDKQSAYLNVFAHAVDIELNSYRSELLQIEQNYLKEEIFVIAQLKIKLNPYFQILPDLHKTIKIIIQDHLKGGQLLDYLFEKTQIGNYLLVQIYQRILKQCYAALYQQFQAWILYGHIIDNFEEFFIQKIEEKQGKQQKYNNLMNIEKVDTDYNWDCSYTLKNSMLANNFITASQAEKILFIGKSVKVLKTQFQGYMPDDSIFALVKDKLETYDSYIFSTVIDSIRNAIGKQLLDVIFKSSEFLLHLENIRKFILMGNGEFFQMFFEDARQLLSLPQTNNAIHELNYNILTQTLIKLDKEDEYSKLIAFFIHNNGFDYKNFQSLQNLVITGNVIQTQHNILRLGPVRRISDWGGIFRDVKESIENGFQMQVVFRFKTMLKASSKLMDNDVHQTSLLIVFHTSDLSKLQMQMPETAVYLRVCLDSKKVSTISLVVKPKQLCKDN